MDEFTMEFAAVEFTWKITSFSQLKLRPVRSWSSFPCTNPEPSSVAYQSKKRFALTLHLYPQGDVNARVPVKDKIKWSHRVSYREATYYTSSID